jgi:hypothetical protein
MAGLSTDGEQGTRTPPRRWRAVLPVTAFAVLVLSVIALPSGPPPQESPFYYSSLFCVLVLLRALLARIVGERGRGWIPYVVLTASSVFWALPIVAAMQWAVRYLRTAGPGSAKGPLQPAAVERFLDGPILPVALVALLALYFALPIAAAVRGRRAGPGGSGGAPSGAARAGS